MRPICGLFVLDYLLAFREIFVRTSVVFAALFDQIVEILLLYTTIITENSTDQRVLFNTVSKLLQKQSTARYPSSCSDALANSFADYFIDKIDRIHATKREEFCAR